MDRRNSTRPDPPPSYSDSTTPAALHSTSTPRAQGPAFLSASLLTSRRLSSRRSTSPPPSYQATAPPTPSLLTSSPAFSEARTLTDFFSTYEWRRAWGPRPRTLNQALLSTCLLGNTPLVSYLLRSGVEIRHTSKYAASKANSAVHEALRGPTPELALTLLEHVFSTTYAAALAQDTGDARAQGIAEEKILGLLDARDVNGCTPLHLAAEAGETEIVGQMLWRGADIEAVDEYGRTAVHMAARYGRSETVRFLVSLGAETRMIEALWQMPGSHAGELGSYGLISKLIKDIVDEGDASLEDARPEYDDASFPSNLVEEQTEYKTISDTNTPSPKLQEITAIKSARTPRMSVDLFHRVTPARYRRAPSAFSAQSPEQWLSQPILSPDDMSVLSSTLASFGKMPRRMRQPPPSLWNSVEYAAWKRDCETLQAEHRAQLDKQKEDGVGMIRYLS